MVQCEAIRQAGTKLEEVRLTAMSFTDGDYFEIPGRIAAVFAALDSMATLLILPLVRRSHPLTGIDDRTLGQKLQILMRLKSDRVVDANVLDTSKRQSTPWNQSARSGIVSRTTSGFSNRTRFGLAE